MDVDIEKVSVSENISSCYLCNEYKVQSLNIMLPKASAYVKGCHEQTNSIKDDDI